MSHGGGKGRTRAPAPARMACPISKTRQDRQFGVGPVIDGLFSQSNFGVVTKMGRPTPQPDAYLTGSLTVANHEDSTFIRHPDLSETPGVCNGSCRLAALCSTQVQHLPGSRTGCHPPVPGAARMASRIRAAASSTPMPGSSTARRRRSASWRNFRREARSSRYPVRRRSMAWAALTRSNFNLEAVHLHGGRRSSLSSTRRPQSSSTAPAYQSTPSRAGRPCPASVDQSARAGDPGGQPMRRSPTPPARSACRTTVFSMPVAPRPVCSSSFSASRSPTIQTRAKMRTLPGDQKIGAQHGWGEYRTIPAMYDARHLPSSTDASMQPHETLKDAIDPNGIISGPPRASSASREDETRQSEQPSRPPTPGPPRPYGCVGAGELPRARPRERPRPVDARHRQRCGPPPRGRQQARPPPPRRSYTRAQSPPCSRSAPTSPPRS